MLITYTPASYAIPYAIHHISLLYHCSRLPLASSASLSASAPHNTVVRHHHHHRSPTIPTMMRRTSSISSISSSGSESEDTMQIFVKTVSGSNSTFPRRSETFGTTLPCTTSTKSHHPANQRHQQFPSQYPQTPQYLHCALSSHSAPRTQHPQTCA